MNSAPVEKRGHPTSPRSNVLKFGTYDPDKYFLQPVSLTVCRDEALSPNCPPYLTQRTVGLYLKTYDRSLNEVPPRPKISEMSDAVLNRMLEQDKANWVDRPGVNAYTLTEAANTYKMSSEISLPNPQAVFPRSNQYEIECVKQRRLTACDGMKRGAKEYPAQCRDCRYPFRPGYTPFQLAWIPDPGQKRWRYYPDLTAKLTDEQIRTSMEQVGRSFMTEACSWYNEHYPSEKYQVIVRKCGK